MRLVLATRNRKKRGEMLEILAGLPVELTDLSAWPDLTDVEETGETFEDNARLKANAAATGTGCWAIGEDSGLVVPALGGAPGVYSARYAGYQRNDDANNAKLLAAMNGLRDDKRAAYYVCCAALADPTGQVKAVVEGRCHGTILREGRGRGGFGYDPLFLVPQHGQTFGELPAEVKHQLSHRGEALRKLRPVLEALIGTK